ncbi:N-acetylmuramoyl-L-alanine amidase [Geodermatophilus sp. CPCC 206100]|uniref:N-acetylmuramoyl-L-alanine amidase n=1 Tax=Geodermatophilus sp. CPCC 206100 TaxID=3020054 RepID=UPI003AFF6BF1
MRRRLTAGLLVFTGVTGALLVLPVSAPPTPDAEPVQTAAEAVPMGSVDDPAPRAEVQEGTSDPVDGAPEGVPTLAVSRTGVSFSLVGVTWERDPEVTDTLVQVRVQDAAGQWGDWTEVSAEDAGADAGQGALADRSGTAPLWTGPSTGVEAELVTRAGAQPRDVRLDLIDPGTSPADTALGEPDIQDTADAAMAMPPVFSRAQWGADERIRTWGPQNAASLKAATLHHTADTNNYTADDVPAMMRSIYRYHTVSLGWGDIGYNVIVDKFGRLWEGRYGGLASTVIGAHAGGFNTGTFGVSMLGNYDAVDTTQPMVDAVSAIIAWKFDLFGVDPRGSTVLTSGGGGTSRYAAGAKVTLPTIFGHRDVGSTACPGRYGYARLGEIRDSVTRRIAASRTPVTDRERNDPWAAGQLGPATTPEWPTSGRDGQYRFYANGAMYWSASTGVHFVLGDLFTRWAQLGYERSPLGYPTQDTYSTGGGDARYNLFQNGAMYSSPSAGVHHLLGATHRRWVELGWEGSPLGYPTTDTAPTRDGDARWTGFQGGAIYETPRNGVRVLMGDVYAAWAASGWEHGPLGFPVGDALPTGGGDATWQAFEHGAVYASPAGVHHLLGATHQRWAALGYEHGALGYPTTDTAPTRDGDARWTGFQGGAIYETPRNGVRVLLGDVYAAWAASGWEHGPLGFPVGDAQPTGGGDATWQAFEHGAVYASRTGVHHLVGDVYQRWAALGYEHGTLGYPTSDVQAVPGGRGRFATFENGALYVSAAGGARIVQGPIRTAWESTGGAAGPLGLPTGDVLPTGGRDATWQAFEHGAVYASRTGVRFLVGDVYRRWAALGWEQGTLGYPTADPRQLGNPGDWGQQAQDFEGGSVVRTTAGTWVVPGDTARLWRSLGAERSVLGVPTSDQWPTRDRDGRYVLFANGAVYWSPATGTHEIVGPVHQQWVALGWEHGRLGYPVSGSIPTATGWRTDFQGGSISYDTTTRQTAVTYR